MIPCFDPGFDPCFDPCFDPYFDPDGFNRDNLLNPTKVS